MEINLDILWKEWKEKKKNIESIGISRIFNSTVVSYMNSGFIYVDHNGIIKNIFRFSGSHQDVLDLVSKGDFRNTERHAIREATLFQGLEFLSPYPGWRDIDFGKPRRSLVAKLVHEFRSDVRSIDPEMAIRLPVDKLQADLAARLHKEQAVAQILDAFDRDVLRLLEWSDMGSLTQNVVDWYGGINATKTSIPSHILVRRRQALEAAPFFAGIMAIDPEIRDAIDSGRPLHPVLAKLLETTSATISAMAHLRLPMEESDPSDRKQAIERLKTVPVDWLKNTKEQSEMEALGVLLSLEQKGTMLGLPEGVFLAGTKGQWKAALSRLAKAASDTRPPEGLEEHVFQFLKDNLDKKEIAAINPDDRPHFVTKRLVAAGLQQKINDETLMKDIASWVSTVVGPDTRLKAMEHVFEDMRSLVRAFSGKLVLPVFLQETGLDGRRLDVDVMAGVERLGGRILFGERSCARVLEMARIFLNNETRLMSTDPDILKDMQNLSATSPEDWTLTQDEKQKFGLASPSGETGPSWPAVAKPVIAPNGLAIVPLTSKGHFEDEGRGWQGSDVNADGSRGLAICVGTNSHYLAKCLSGEGQVLSIRKPSHDGAPFERVSCVELNFKDTRTPECIQHRSRSNRTPPPEAANAIEWWLTNFGKKNIPVNPYWESFAKNVKRHASFDQTKLICGYDWRKHESIRFAFDTWRDVLGKDVPALEEMKVLPVFRAFVDESNNALDVLDLSPAYGSRGW